MINVESGFTKLTKTILAVQINKDKKIMQKQIQQKKTTVAVYLLTKIYRDDLVVVSL